jgi:hypothetical protein
MAAAGSPGAGSKPVTTEAMPAVFRHRAGWLAISLVMARTQVNLPFLSLRQQH